MLFSLFNKKISLYSLLRNQNFDVREKMLNNNGVYTFLSYYSIKIAASLKIDYKKFSAIGIDGIFLTFLFKKVFNYKNIRLSFDNTSIGFEIFSQMNSKRLSLIVIGSDENSLNHFNIYIREKYPNIQIAYSRNGFFNKVNEYNEVIEKICNLKPDVVLIGMGTSLQDSLALRIYEKYTTCRVFTCGGFISQTSMVKGDYFPQLVNDLNLRFLYRIYKEKNILPKILPEVLFVPFYVLFIAIKRND
jgi:UDP-N-acetyl-D-mannosaminuronic acid transferase (WecB/TagA/CpsF family)